MASARLRPLSLALALCNLAAGRIDGVDVPAYAEEPGVDPARGTETFAEVTLMIDNLRWAGVPFVLRGGKALSRFRAEIAVHLQSGAPPRLPAGGRPPA